MEKVMIQKDGMLVKDDRSFGGNSLSLLGHCVILQDGFCLSSFFSMVRQYPELKIISELLSALLEMVSEDDSSLLNTDEIDALTFYKTIEITGFPGTPSISIYNCLKGCSGNELKDLKFFQLESLMGHNLSFGQLKHIVFGDHQDEFRYDTFYTLFELIEGVSWELSFNFNPLQCSIRR